MVIDDENFRINDNDVQLDFKEIEDYEDKTDIIMNKDYENVKKKFNESQSKTEVRRKN